MQRPYSCGRPIGPRRLCTVNGKNPYRCCSLLQNGQHHRNIIAHLRLLLLVFPFNLLLIKWAREDSELLEYLCEDGTIGVNSASVGLTYRLLKESQGMVRPTEMRIQSVSYFQLSTSNRLAHLMRDRPKSDFDCPAGEWGRRKKYFGRRELGPASPQSTLRSQPKKVSGLSACQFSILTQLALLPDIFLAHRPFHR